MTQPTNRRDLLRLAAASAVATSLPRWAWSQTLRQRNLFPLGVASGAPSADGFVLWTRLLGGPVPGLASGGSDAGAPLSGPLTVQWQVADDDAFTRIVQSGQATAEPALGHSVHVEVTGLRPDRWYFYRFMHGDAVTPVARTRTVPAADALVARLRVAYASCQRWEQGHYAGYRHMASDQPDLVLFLGDYIYEYAMPSKPPARPLARTHTLRLAENLQDYRDRYALYKTDPHLQAMHRVCPWVVSWDDHEVQNDYAGLIGTGSEASFLQRRQGGYQAFYENMPLRASALVNGLQGLGSNDALRVHSRTTYGRLATFHMMDTRQFRDLQACRVPGSAAGGAISNESCPERADPKRTMLGKAQEQWLDEGLAQDGANDRTRWSVLAQQTIFSQRNYKVAPEESYHASTWDGYPAARQRVLDAVKARAPRNTVFLGGDIHQNYVCQVHADFARPDSPVIASEFCGTSIASATSVAQSTTDAIREKNPHILLARSDQRGYVIADVTPDSWTTQLRVLDDVSREDSGVSTLARFVVKDRRPGTEQVN